jgi:hypothetical protein
MDALNITDKAKISENQMLEKRKNLMAGIRDAIIQGSERRTEEFGDSGGIVHKKKKKKGKQETEERDIELL